MRVVKKRRRGREEKKGEWPQKGRVDSVVRRHRILLEGTDLSLRNRKEAKEKKACESKAC